MMSSMPSPSTGMRLKPAASAASSASCTVASSSTVTMSGRGVMTSRATVSPKSMMEWMKVRSSFSITFSSWATSAMALSSESVMYECVSSWLPRPRADDAVGQPVEQRESHWMGGKRISALDERRAEQRGAVGVHARPSSSGTASKKTKITTTSKTMPSDHAPGTEDVLGHDADQGGRHQLAHQHQQQNGVEEVGRVLDQLGQRAGAVALVVDQRLGLDFARAHQAGLGHGEHARAGQEHGDDDDEDGVLGVEARGGQEGGPPRRPHARLPTR